MYEINNGMGQGVGWMEVQKGEDICIHITDSLHCMTETNTIL